MHLTHRGWVHHATSSVHRELLASFWGKIGSTTRWPIGVLGITVRATRGVYPGADPVPSHHSLLARESSDILGKRNRVPAELPQAARPRQRYETDLHVLERDKHGLNQGRTIEERLQIIERKTKAGIHVVQITEARDDVLTALLQRHGIHLPATTETGPVTAFGNAIVRLQIGQLIPSGNRDAASSHAILPSLQDLHVIRDRWRWRIRRMEGWETFITLMTLEKHHARQNRMHGLRCSKGHVAQAHVVLRNTDRKLLQRHHKMPRTNLLQTLPTAKIHPLLPSFFELCPRNSLPSITQSSRATP